MGLLLLMGGGSFRGLLDQYTGAIAAYSLRQLRSGATKAIRVRRASDSAEQDIGFTTTGRLNISQLALFCNGTDGFVTTLYDQTTTAGNQTQAVAINQPKIFDSVAGVVTKNSLPAFEFDGSNDLLTGTVAGFRDIENLSVFCVNSPQAAAAIDTTTQHVFGYANGGVGSAGVAGGLSVGGASAFVSNEKQTILFHSATIANGRLGSSGYSHSAEEHLLHSMFFLASGTSYFKNGSGITFDSVFGMTTSTNTSPKSAGIASDAVYVGSLTGTVATPRQKMQEIIFFNGNQTANRAAIETAINGYWGVY